MEVRDIIIVAIVFVFSAIGLAFVLLALSALPDVLRAIGLSSLLWLTPFLWFIAILGIILTAVFCLLLWYYW